MTKALGKEGPFAEDTYHCPRQRFFGKILQNFFAERHGWRLLANIFGKKIKISLPRARGEALGKDFFFLKKEQFFAERPRR
jgi:hypothetical protein